VRVLLDENLPVRLADTLRAHEVDTVVGLGWAGVTNGELLRRAAGHFDALVTMDKQLEHQQAVRTLPFGVVLLLAPSNRMTDLQPLVPDLLRALDSLQASTVVRVGA
jgi:predicted nuclease of predicted toxin-antitoxin system